MRPFPVWFLSWFTDMTTLSYSRAGVIPELAERARPSYDIPEDLETLYELFDIQDEGVSTTNFDFMTDVIVDDTRERMFSAEAFTLSSDNWGDDDAPEPVDLEDIGKTKAMIKVCFPDGTR